MSVTQEQVEKLSKVLSKVEGGEKLADDVNGILEYIDLLNDVDTTGVAPTISVVDKENILREDVIKKDGPTTKELLECSPQKVISNQIAITNIMK